MSKAGVTLSRWSHPLRSCFSLCNSCSVLGLLSLMAVACCVVRLPEPCKTAEAGLGDQTARINGVSVHSEEAPGGLNRLLRVRRTVMAWEVPGTMSEPLRVLFAQSMKTRTGPRTCAGSLRW